MNKTVIHYTLACNVSILLLIFASYILFICHTRNKSSALLNSSNSYYFLVTLSTFNVKYFIDFEKSIYTMFYLIRVVAASKMIYLSKYKSTIKQLKVQMLNIKITK